MCSRYFLDADGNIIAYTFQVPVHDRIRKRFNIAPTQEAPVIRAGAGGAREVAMLRWGLVPFWAKDLKVGTKMINARSETAPDKPSFRSAFRRRRCLIPADGFYEWKREEGGKQPFYIRMKDGRPFAFAGLWESWHDDEVRSCAILTTQANALVGDVHERMPVILPGEDYEAWLDPEAEREELVSLLRPYPGEDLETFPVSRFVNSPRNNDERCVEPAA